ncbi:VIT1/CCC1 transporter family protein [Rubeoparvulum massiliense]|uniref:VIT1/CCC1 transporter family protein n=1 Tax=Rubeoparvulum massiliense TaxID=1631346 RepID=UPI00065E4605|nr:VIT1/CCC1 transporter family protein [Rubeoparvulum massiliense]
MSKTVHQEKHFGASDVVRDVVIGMADGLTVPFALAAGLTGAVDSTGIILTAGMAEIAAGSIAMGLGGYLAAKSEKEHYESERRREEEEIIHLPEREEEEVREIFREYGVEEEHLDPIMEGMKRKPEKWVDFMMRFELGLEEPDPKRGLKSALTIAISYILGGLIPLLPYFFFAQPLEALKISVVGTLIVLFLFGAFKGKFTGAAPLKSGVETMIVGGIAAAAAFGLANLLS